MCVCALRTAWHSLNLVGWREEKQVSRPRRFTQKGVLIHLRDPHRGTARWGSVPASLLKGGGPKGLGDPGPLLAF